MPGVPVIMALDIATTCGVSVAAVGAEPPLLQWGSRNFGQGLSTGQIISMFSAWFKARTYESRPRLVVYESVYIPPQMINSATTERLYGMTGQVQATCVDLGIACRQVGTQEFTKYMTGHGRFPGANAAARRKAKKQAVIKACRYYGCEVGDDDDAADALGIWFYAESIMAPRASEHRRRLAADRERETIGAGPLFTNPEKDNAPLGTNQRGVVQPHGGDQATWSKLQTTM